MTATDALRDRIARALFLQEFPSAADAWDAPGESGRVRYRRRADAVLAVLADADPTDIGGRTLTKIRMLEQERDAMQRRTSELAEQVAAVRDDLWGLVWLHLNARPRTKETPDAG